MDPQPETTQTQRKIYIVYKVLYSIIKTKRYEVVK